MFITGSLGKYALAIRSLIVTHNSVAIRYGNINNTSSSVPYLDSLRTTTCLQADGRTHTGSLLHPCYVTLFSAYAMPTHHYVPPGERSNKSVTTPPVPCVCSEQISNRFTYTTVATHFHFSPCRLRKSTCCRACWPRCSATRTRPRCTGLTTAEQVVYVGVYGTATRSTRDRLGRPVDSENVI